MNATTDTSTAAVIRTEGLTKRYGERRGVFDLDLSVHEGEIFGFLGPNGAGKTTTIRLLLDLIRPNAGRAEVLGLDSHHDAVAIYRQTGYLPGELALDPHLTGRQILVYLGNLRGGVEWAHVERLAHQLELNLDQRFGQYSRGNKQKVGLVQAFMHRPRLLILDEPTGGLDPLNQETVLDMVRAARDGGATIFFSSHILSEVETLCERVGFIRDGSLVEVAAVQDLPGMRVLTVEAELDAPPPTDALANVPGIGDATVEGTTVRCAVRGDMDPLLRALARYHIRRLVSREPSLNDIFLHLYETDPSARAPALGRVEEEEPSGVAGGG
jgi:ABC-2 type transport system ATP-binding protein